MTMVEKQGRVGTVQPFALDGIERDAAGILRYTDLAPSLLAVLRTSAERAGPYFRRSI